MTDEPKQERITPEMKLERERAAKGKPVKAELDSDLVAEVEALTEVRDQLAASNTELQKQVDASTDNSDTETSEDTEAA